jgi:hypothetical protein
MQGLRTVVDLSGNLQFVGRYLEGEISSDEAEGTNISTQTYTQLPCPKAHRGQMKTFHRFIAGTDSAAVQCEAKAVKALWATERSIRMFLFIV